MREGNNENRFSRKSIFAGLTAFSLLGVLILVNFYKSYQDTHQTSVSSASIEREKLPEILEGKGKQLAFHDFESGSAADTNAHLANTGHGGKQSYRMSSTVPFSPGLWIKFKDIKPGDSSWIRATGYVWFSCPPREIQCNLVATCNRHDVTYKYMFIPLENENLKQNQWNRVAIDYRIPLATDREDVLQAYFWYHGQGELLVDDIEINYFTPDGSR
ncbi:MAG: hypothetical protein NTW16_16490 [Bacteroidetes bacterium]|nr:hypothetical protein [Bacteroidota bacterium]